MQFNEASVIISLHTESWGCGIANFNEALGQKFNLEVISIQEWGVRNCPPGILSIGFHEMDLQYVSFLEELVLSRNPYYYLIVHSIQENTNINGITLQNAQKILALNEAIFYQLSKWYDYVYRGSVPSLIKQREFPSSTDKTFTLFTFGMAHKQNSRRLKDLLQAVIKWGLVPRIEFSLAVHLGMPYPTIKEDFFDISESFPLIHCNYLGFLSDNYLVEHLRRADLVFRFFEDGFRSNFTSLMAAFQASKPVVTNVDEFSPKWLYHGENFLDIDLIGKNKSRPDLDRIGRKGGEDYAANNSWQHAWKLLENFVNE